MAGSGFETVSGRYQFRLDLKDPSQLALARRLFELPGGQRNRFIVEKLIAPETGADTAAIKEALREVLLEFSAASPAPAIPQDAGLPPDDLFDTTLFK